MLEARDVKKYNLAIFPFDLPANSVRFLEFSSLILLTYKLNSDCEPNEHAGFQLEEKIRSAVHINSCNSIC